jgi:hypothetical protein
VGIQEKTRRKSLTWLSIAVLLVCIIYREREDDEDEGKCRHVENQEQRKQTVDSKLARNKQHCWITHLL